MRKYPVALLSLWLMSCGSEQTERAVVTKTVTQQKPKKDSLMVSPAGAIKKSNEPGDLTGCYVGEFYGLWDDIDLSKDFSKSNRINISVDSIRGEKIYGHSVVAGNMRPFKGTIDTSEYDKTVVAKEPGTDKYDGVFSFSIAGDGTKINGNWRAYNKNLAVTSRDYNLEKKQFAYDANNAITDIGYGPLREKFSPDSGEVVSNDAMKFNASVVELKKEDIENMSATDLEVMRNAIYARHGYSFKNRKMRYFFDSNIDWYIPMKTDVRKDLTALEKKNIALIKRYEEHAEKYYDTFGR